MVIRCQMYVKYITPSVTRPCRDFYKIPNLHNNDDVYVSFMMSFCVILFQSCILLTSLFSSLEAIASQKCLPSVPGTNCCPFVQQSVHAPSMPYVPIWWVHWSAVVGLMDCIFQICLLVFFQVSNVIHINGLRLLTAI